MILSLSKRTHCRFMIQSERLFPLPIHFMGRSLLCGGEGCIACDYTSSKLVWFFGATVNRAPHVIECCNTLAVSILEKCATINTLSMKGVIVGVQRKTLRGMWQCTEFDHRPEMASPVTDQFVCNAISTLYKVPVAVLGEEYGHWLKRVQKLHQPFLKNCFIAGDAVE